jgi:subtilisin family serine protease
MMEARVTNYLNVRTGGPEILPYNNPGFLLPNETITVVDTVKGQEYKGNDVWYQIEGGGFVWSGAVEQQILANALDWWHAAYQIVDVWKALDTWGGHSKIAVIDSGIDLSNPFIDQKLVVAKNADPTSNDISDKTGHGTGVVSIICGNRISNFGIAPRCGVHLIKAYKKSTIKADDLMKALRAVPEEIDIINISQALPFSETLEQELVAHFNDNKHKVFICAAGNDGTQQVVNNLPSSTASKCDNVIAVAGVDETGVASAEFSCRSDHLTLAAPGEGINYANKFDPTKMYDGGGTSFASPIVAGLIALGKSYQLKRKVFKDVSSIAAMLKETVTPKPSSEKQLYGLGIVNPLEFCKRIQTK